MIRRRRVSWMLAMLALACGAVGGKLVTMYAFAAAGTAAYDDGRYDDAERNFSNLEVLNVIDPWRALLGIGDARYGDGDLIGAEEAFRRALELNPASCPIRFNLAVTIEAIGDESYRTARGAIADAVTRYRDALTVATSGACDAALAGEPGERLDETAVRIEEKLAALTDEDPFDTEQEVEPTADSERGDSEQINELEDRNEIGASRREASRDDQGGVPPTGHSNW